MARNNESVGFSHRIDQMLPWYIFSGSVAKAETGKLSLHLYPYKVERVYHILSYMSIYFAPVILHKSARDPSLRSCYLKVAPTIEGAAQGAFVGVFQVSAVGEAARQAGDTHLEGL